MWDSNPREVLPSGGLVNRCLQPLGQSSSIFASLKLSSFGKIGLVTAKELEVPEKSETNHFSPTDANPPYISLLFTTIVVHASIDENGKKSKLSLVGKREELYLDVLW